LVSSEGIMMIKKVPAKLIKPQKAQILAKICKRIPGLDCLDFIG